MSGPDEDAALAALRDTVLARKAAGRQERAALSWSEKLLLIERLRERDAAFKPNRERARQSSAGAAGPVPDDGEAER